MISSEYLVSYGAAGEFGRFVPVEPVECVRGDRVVVRSRRGLEIGTILCPATTGHAHLLGDQAVGALLRRAAADDERRIEELATASSQAFEEARRLAETLHLPLWIVDVEAVFEPRRLIVHHFGPAGDPRDLVSSLARRFDAQIELLALESPPLDEEDHDHGSCGSCGSGGCGSCGEGGCGSCGEGGCGTKAPITEEWREHFVELRSKMDRQFGRTM
jgi:cell fate regulator YaaT (PSP1 superfamily)